MNDLKIKAAQAALQHIPDGITLGVGTGSTVNLFIEQLLKIRSRIEACVASSIETEKRLSQAGFVVLDLNVVDELALYIDGADEVNHAKCMLKGGGGALTREKILASAAKQFIVMVDERKLVDRLGHFPLAVEVLPLARSFVARELVKLGGDPVYRQGFTTDNGHIILDVFNLPLDDLSYWEDKINVIPGVVNNGIFANRPADWVIVGKPQGIFEF